MFINALNIIYEDSSIVIQTKYDLAFEQNLLRDIVSSNEKDSIFLSEVILRMMYYYFNKNEDLVNLKTNVVKRIQERLYFSNSSGIICDNLDIKIKVIKESFSLIKMLFI